VVAARGGGGRVRPDESFDYQENSRARRVRREDGTPRRAAPRRATPRHATPRHAAPYLFQHAPPTLRRTAQGLERLAYTSRLTGTDGVAAKPGHGEARPGFRHAPHATRAAAAPHKRSKASAGKIEP